MERRQKKLQSYKQIQTLKILSLLSHVLRSFLFIILQNCCSFPRSLQYGSALPSSEAAEVQPVLRLGMVIGMQNEMQNEILIGFKKLPL